MPFTTVDLDLNTGYWEGMDEAPTADYSLRYFKDYSNPKTGYQGAIMGFKINFSGVDFISYDSATEVVPCGNLVRPNDDTSYAQASPAPRQVTEKPADWEYAYMDYAKQNKAYGAGTNWYYYSPYSYLSNSFDANNCWRYPTNTQFQHFYTEGQGFFSTGHTWINATYPTEISAPFFMSNPLTSGASVGNRNYAVGYWRFGGYSGSLPPTEGGVYPSSGISIETPRGRQPTSIAKGDTIQPRMKQFFVSFDTKGLEGLGIKTFREDGSSSNPFNSDPIREENFAGIITIYFSADGIPQRAYIDAITLDFWQPAGKVGTWGADTGIEGGDGSFRVDHTDQGDAGGQTAKDDASKKNAGSNGFLGGGGTYGLTLWSGFSLPSLCGALFLPSDPDKGDLAPIFKKFEQSFFNPLSAIVACHAITSSFSVAASNSTPHNITIAGWDTGITGNWHDNTIAVHHVGSYHVPNKYFGAYPDFAPFTTAKLYLPYIGYIDIDVNLFQYGYIAVDYECDMLNGNVVAYVYTQDKDLHRMLAYTASGNCAFPTPIYGNSMDGTAIGKSLVGSVVSAAAGAAIVSPFMKAAETTTLLPSIAPAAIGAGAGLAAGAATIGGAAVGASSAIGAMKQNPTVIGNFGAGSSRITCLDCFILIQRPEWANQTDRRDLVGMPSYQGGTVEMASASKAGFGGFLKVQEIDLSAVTCTAQEKQEIERIFKSGVYLPRNDG